MLSQAGSCALNIDIENPLAENVAEVEKFLDVLSHNSD